MKKIALLGAGSSVGRYILSSTGPNVVGIIRSNRALSQLCDLNLGNRLIVAEDCAALSDALNGCCSVVNLVNDANPFSAKRSLSALIEACVAAKVPQLIHISSAAVYGPRAGEVNGLDDCLWWPSWSSYAIGKRWQESVIKKNAHRFPSVVVLRPGLIWGPGMAWLNGPACELARGIAWVVEGDSKCNLVNIGFLKHAILELVSIQPGGLVWCNIADKKRLTWSAYYQAIASELGLGTAKIEVLPRQRFKWWSGAKSLRYVWPFGLGWSIATPSQKSLVKKILRRPINHYLSCKVTGGKAWSVCINRETWELKSFDGLLPGCELNERLHASFKLSVSEQWGEVKALRPWFAVDHGSIRD